VRCPGGEGRSRSRRSRRRRSRLAGRDAIEDGIAGWWGAGRGLVRCGGEREGGGGGGERE